jgi:hypothetical protein
MFRFHPIFWLFVALFYLFVFRRRRWARRWSMAGPMGYPPNAPSGWEPRRTGEWTDRPQAPAAPRPLTQPDSALVESLESRIAGLEQRLDFAERLLAGRKDESPGA